MGCLIALVVGFVLISACGLILEARDRRRAEAERERLNRRMQDPASGSAHPHDWRDRVSHVHRRDRVCVRCGGTAGLQVHHRIPRSRLWNHSVDNLELLCVYCHSEEHHSDFVPAALSWAAKRTKRRPIRAKTPTVCEKCGAQIPMNSLCYFRKRSGSLCERCVLGG